MYTGNIKIEKAYLVDYNTAEKLEFQYNPNEWEDNRSVNYSTITIPGISHPVYQFTAGGERIVKFVLITNAMYKKNAPFEISHWIRARTYPVRSDFVLENAPPRVVFIWPNAISMLAIITVANRKIIDHFPDGRIKIMTIDVELKEVITKSWSFQRVR
jgi:hypothetical protein